ncbi:MAG: MoaD/ThiS family protein [Mariprofundaceae bacterium]
MSVRVLFFGIIAEKVKQHEIYLPSAAGLSIKEVVTLVKCDQYKPLIFAVNQQQENDLSLLIKDGDEIAIMPPFSGG